MELKWIKLATGIFDNRKIKQIELLPDGDTILIIWIKLLSLAGMINNNGLVYVTKDIPFTEEMLAGEFRRPINTVRLALATFQKFGMITITDDIIQITGWTKHQGGTAAIETAAEKNRLRQQRHRDKQKLLAAGSETADNSPENDNNNVMRNVTRNVTGKRDTNVTDNVSNACRIEKNKKRIERDISYTTTVKEQTGDPQSYPQDQQNEAANESYEAVTMFQNTFRPLKNIFEADRIRAMVDEYGLAAFKWAFEIAKKKRPKVPLSYLEEVLKNRDGPDGNDPVAGAEAASKILESGELIDYGSE